MYKKQMAFQKIVCLLALVASAVVFVYSLGLMTDLFDSLYETMWNPSDHTQTDVPGSIIYYDMQGFNALLLRIGIGLILLGVLLYITNTHSRRKYYVGNYVSSIVYMAAGLAAAVWAHIQLQAFRAQFLQVDFEAMKEYAELWDTPYIDSTFWFDIHYAVFGLVLAACVTLGVNLIWKKRVMNEEKALIEAGKDAAK